MHKGQAPLRLVVPTSAYNSAENCMPKSCSKSTSSSSLPLDVPIFPVKQRKPIPHEFVLDEIASLSPRTRLMFGCLAIYVQQRGEESGREKIVLFLRDKPASPEDNGVWLATTYEHHESLREEFPSMRSIKVLGKDVTGWQVLPADSDDFEESARRACELVLAYDPRIGKIPGARPKPQAKKSGHKKKPASPRRRS
jgi:hypothetical protein